MGNATERIFRTADGQLVSEANVKDGKAGGLGTTLAYAEGDEITDEDAKLFKSGATPEPKATPSGPLDTSLGSSATATETSQAKSAPKAASKK